MPNLAAGREPVLLGGGVSENFGRDGAMLQRIISIKGVGRFRNCGAVGDVAFRRYTLIFAENGRGKTTVLDNLTPYPTMPSRAGGDGSGAFSYYEHVYLPENVKDLVWDHGGRRYRSQLIIRNESRRKTEAYLHVMDGTRWLPVTVSDGTVSDGKMDTYVRCLEAVLGAERTFFVSAFAAQGRRQL